MAERPEELEGWREAWRELVPPGADDAGAADELDEATAGVVRYLRRAWELVEAPPPPAIPVPANPVRRPRARSSPGLAAAALLVALLGGSLLLRKEHGSRPRHPEVSGETRPTDHPGSATAAPRIASLEPDRLELRSGPVRLILLTPARAQPLDGAPR